MSLSKKQREREESDIMRAGKKGMDRAKAIGAPVDDLVILATTGGHPQVDDRIAYLWSAPDGLHLAGGEQGGPVVIAHADILGVGQRGDEVVMTFMHDGVKRRLMFPYAP